MKSIAAKSMVAREDTNALSSEFPWVFKLKGLNR